MTPGRRSTEQGQSQGIIDRKDLGTGLVVCACVTECVRGCLCVV